MNILLPMDVGVAIDICSIKHVKSVVNPDETNNSQYQEICDSISQSITKDLFFKIQNSPEYRALFSINKEIFDVVHIYELGFGRAIYSVYLNWVRHVYKNQIMLKFFNQSTLEIKIGFEDWSNFLFIRDSPYLVILDEDEKHRLKGEKISIVAGGYVCRSGKRLHREIMERAGFNLDGKEVDHKNGNKLDNRRCNLRVCCGYENCRNRITDRRNSSGFRGVFPMRAGWRCTLGFRRRYYTVQGFKTSYDAALAYDLIGELFCPEFSIKNIQNPTHADIKRVCEHVFHINRRHGYYFNIKSRKWNVSLHHAGQYNFIGTFLTEEDALVKADEHLRKAGRINKINIKTKDEKLLYLQGLLKLTDEIYNLMNSTLYKFAVGEQLVSPVQQNVGPSVEPYNPVWPNR